jgi:hypothetical protein
VVAEAENVVAIWKMNWPLALDVPLSVSVVERAALEVGKM